MRDALYPPAVAMVTVAPYVGSDPANVTSPDVGALVEDASPSATSIPRCWPPAYLSVPTENPRSTAPSAGHVQAQAAGPATSAHTSTAPRQMANLVALRVNTVRR
jgi:hypothetical protein